MYFTLYIQLAIKERTGYRVRIFNRDFFPLFREKRYLIVIKRYLLLIKKYPRYGDNFEFTLFGFPMVFTVTDAEDQQGFDSHLYLNELTIDKDSLKEERKQNLLVMEEKLERLYAQMDQEQLGSYKVLRLTTQKPTA